MPAEASEALAVPQPPRRRATYDDLLAVPDHLVAEILDGELHVSPRPAAPHAAAHTYLLGALVSTLGGGGSGPPADAAWWFLTEPELHFADDVLVPDIAGWRRARLPAIPDAAFMTLAPDWVCEVVSPSTARIDRAKKMPIYAREGVRHAWLVDPLARTLEVYRLDGASWLLVVTHAGDGAVRAEPFDAAELEMARWWVPESGAAAPEASASAP